MIKTQQMPIVPSSRTKSSPQSALNQINNLRQVQVCWEQVRPCRFWLKTIRKNVIRTSTLRKRFWWKITIRMLPIIGTIRAIRNTKLRIIQRYKRRSLETLAAYPPKPSQCANWTIKDRNFLLVFQNSIGCPWAIALWLILPIISPCNLLKLIVAKSLSCKKILPTPFKKKETQSFLTSRNLFRKKPTIPTWTMLSN